MTSACEGRVRDNAHNMFRTRFKKDIVAEFLPASRPRKRQNLIILCDGMPSIPRKQPLPEFLTGKGYWVIYPRYRGAWESGGQFLQKSPHEDILDVLDELPQDVEELAFGRRFKLAPDQVFVIGGSFGAPRQSSCRWTRGFSAWSPIAQSWTGEFSMGPRRWKLQTRIMRNTSAKPSAMHTGFPIATGESSEVGLSIIPGTIERKLIRRRFSCFTRKTIPSCLTIAVSNSRKSQASH